MFTDTMMTCITGGLTFIKSDVAILQAELILFFSFE